MQKQPDPALPSYAQLLEQNAQLKEQVQSLMVQLARQQQAILELQARLGKNSTNSSKPPSSDGLAKPAPKSLRVPGQRPIGAPKGHQGNTLRQSEVVDSVMEHFGPGQCSACQRVLLDHQVIERRQVLELPVLRAQVIEHRRMRSVCTCGAVHAGGFPLEITAPVQYGARLKAVCVNLNQQQFVPLARTSEFMADTFGVAVSETSVLAFTHEAAQVLQPLYQQIGRAVQAAPVVCADETGIRIQGKLEWLHCAVTPGLTYLEHHPKRGLLAIEAIGILPNVTGTLVHDGLQSYKQLDCAHALCNAHHLRELVYVHDSLGEKAFDGWAGEMMDTLGQAKKEVDALGGPFKPERMRWYEVQWLALLDRGERLNPRQEPDGAPTGKRGKHKQSTQFNLLARLRQYKADVWRFATDVGAPFTNNLAEQALRMSKVRQKVSGCFRTDEGAKTFFAIRSYLQTMRKQCINLFDCLVSVFDGQPLNPDFAV
ncbi:IS66 family transposase [soil metagenome]